MDYPSIGNGYVMVVGLRRIYDWFRFGSLLANCLGFYCDWITVGLSFFAIVHFLFVVRIVVFSDCMPFLCCWVMSAIFYCLDFSIVTEGLSISVIGPSVAGGRVGCFIMIGIPLV